MIKTIFGILAAIGLAIATILGFKNKNVIEAILNNNNKVNDDVKNLQTTQVGNSVSITIEEQKRVELQKNIDNRNAGTRMATPEEMLAFFNKTSGDKK